MLAVGVLYAVAVSVIGFGIPCIFHKITGLQCPGCGISRMFLSLFRGDFASAWGYNPAVICLAAPGAAVFADISVRYIRDGSLVPHRWANVTACVILAALLMFGVLRNIPFN